MNHKEEADRLLADVRFPDGTYCRGSDGKLFNGEVILAHAILALIEALKDGRLLGAGLDTLREEPPDPANPILKLSNVVLTPHSAGPTADSFRKRFQNGYANIQRVANGQCPLWIIPEMRDLFA